MKRLFSRTKETDQPIVIEKQTLPHVLKINQGTAEAYDHHCEYEIEGNNHTFNGDGIVLIMSDDKGEIGHVEAYKEDILKVDKVYVRVDMRSKGVGEQMMKLFEGYATQLDYYEFKLFANSSERDRTVKFYEKLGYYQSGGGLTGIYMNKELERPLEEQKERGMMKRMLETIKDYMTNIRG